MTARALLGAAVVVILFAALPVTVPAASTPIYQDTSYSFAERSADLVSRMTLAQKASQMNSSMASAISALGIPTYGWWNEALHGVSREQLVNNANATVLINTTSYPISLSLGSTWDPELMYREAQMIADEAREVVRTNTLDLDFYSPTINLARDPRWGRNDEAISEDPFLTAAIASQFVNGMEGKDQNGKLLLAGNGYLKAITTLKHYAANNSEVNRRTGTADMDDRTLREYYTAQFRSIVQQAQPGSIMTSYNRVNGVPTSASVYLMDNLARQTFGFEGYFTGDCDSIFEMQRGHNWVPPGSSSAVNSTTRHAYAMSAGEDLDCNQGFHDSFNYGNTVVGAVAANITTETGRYTENDVDTSMVRLFTARMQLGEFDAPSNLVPWVTQARQRVPQGTWTNSNSNNAVTETPERLAMAREVGAKSIVLLKNSVTTRKDGSTGRLLPLQVPTSGPFSVGVIGFFSNPNSMYLGGYSSTQQSAGTAKSVNGYNGIRNAILAINPSATVTHYKGFTGTGTTAASLTTVDSAAVNASADHDAVIVYVGTDSGTAAEDTDRTSLALPGAQASLISQVAARNPNTIVYMETIGLVQVTSFEPNVAAMLWSSYNGQRKGEALADVLLGAYNPSGRLPFTWYQSTSQLPAITNYNIRPVGTTPGRTYMYFGGQPSYHFGHGLSYSNFAYSNLQIDNKNLDANDTFDVSVDVTNTSAAQRGTEVVELYINTPDAPASLERPSKRLRGFQKVTLDPGETKTVTLTVNVPDLAFFDQTLGRFVVDNGRYGVQISKSSADADIELQDVIQVSGTLNHVPNVITVKPTMQGDAAQDIPTRVMFPQGVVVTPNVTVAMNDDTLYGYIRKNGSKPFPAGMTITYTSNRPGVVPVDEDGVIRTVKSGVATVTATVTYAGVSKTAGFVIYVQLTDATPPVTTASLSPAAVNGWYGDPAVTLAATDDNLGVDHTEYRLDGAPQWTTYAGPFQVTGDGDHTLDYRSVDLGGNEEAVKTLPFKIDATPPTVSIVSPADGAVYQAGSGVTAAYSCDDALSGIADPSGTTLFSAASPSETNIKVVSIPAGLAVGKKIDVGSGAGLESARVTAVGTPASSTMLAALALPGATNIKVASVADLDAGDTITIDTGSLAETRAIQSVGTAGAGGTGVTLTSALELLHPSGAAVSGPGGGITVTPALTRAHPSGDPVTVEFCTGTAANGEPIDTSSGGLHTFTVDARDRAGNESTQTVTYFVSRAPEAVDDSATVVRGGSVDVDVLANDTDADGDASTVVSFTQGAHGTVSENADGTLRYVHDGTVTSSDSFAYTVSDGNGGTASAIVRITVTQTIAGGNSTTGGGWLGTSGGGKVNFGFVAKSTAAGFEGDLKLNDKGAGVKIHLSTLTSLGPVEAPCGGVPVSASSLEFSGRGTYNGAVASFRVCVLDSGGPGGTGSAAADRLYLQCTSGCGYETGTHAQDDAIDGGNIQVRQAAPATMAFSSSPASRSRTSNSSASESEPATIVLDPLLLTEGVIGQVQVFTITVYDREQRPLPNASVLLTATTSSGTQVLTAVTDLAGKAFVLTTNLAQPAEYMATAGRAQSNTIQLTPVVTR